MKIPALDTHRVSLAASETALPGSADGSARLASTEGAPPSPNVQGAAKNKLHEAAREFEAILIRQVLTQAHVGGKQGGAYGDLAVDAIAQSLTEKDGFGLAREIELALDEAHQSNRARK